MKNEGFGLPGDAREFTLQILALNSLAVVHPVLEILSGRPEFFLAHGAGARELFLLVVTGLFALPLPALLTVFAARQLPAPAATEFLMDFWIALCSGTLALLWTRTWNWLPGTAAIGIAAVLGIVIAFCRRRIRLFRTFLSFLFIATIAVPLIFFLNPQISRVLSSGSQPQSTAVKVRTPVPIVWIVWDEFPVFPLMDGHGNLDSRRFPNYSRLAACSTWYRNAITVSDETIYSVPALLTGQNPIPGALPGARDYPRNLFTLLRDSYELHGTETQTHLYAGKEQETVLLRTASILSDASAVYLRRLIPDDLSESLPSVSNRWKDFWHGPDTNGMDRGALFEQFLGGIQKSSPVRPQLFFLHEILPHGPYEYLPSGARYDWQRNAAPELDSRRPPSEQSGYQEHCRRYNQRLLMQIGYTDRLIGQLLDVLEKRGMLRESMLIVTADHGISFDPESPRRKLTGSNAAEILRIPLFVKLPGQTQGRVLDLPATTLDILPTILEATGAEGAPRMDGIPLSNEFRPPARRRVLRSAIQPTPQWIVLNPDPPASEPALQRKQEWFGSGDLEPTYRIGPHTEWLGQSEREFIKLGKSDLELELYSADEFQNVEPGSGRLPCLVRGKLLNAPETLPVLGIAINGRFAAFVRPSGVWLGAGRARILQFEALVPESCFVAGKNTVRIYEVLEGRRLRIPEVRPG